MDLNTFGTDIIKHLSRLANSAEAIEMALKAKQGAGTTSAPTASSSAATTTETPAEKKKREAAERKAADAAAAAAAASSAPKVERADVNKALVAVKDTISKEAAQAVYAKYKYTAMSKIEEKDFAAILADAEQELEDFTNKTGKYEVTDAPLDDGDDDL